MKTKALKHFRAKLASDEPVYGLWVTLESASITEMVVALGIDWVVITGIPVHIDIRCLASLNVPANPNKKICGRLVRRVYSHREEAKVKFESV